MSNILFELHYLIKVTFSYSIAKLSGRVVLPWCHLKLSVHRAVGVKERRQSRAEESRHIPKMCSRYGIQVDL